jgi:hypothetical protein
MLQITYHVPVTLQHLISYNPKSTTTRGTSIALRFVYGLLMAEHDYAVSTIRDASTLVSGPNRHFGEHLNGRRAR